MVVSKQPLTCDSDLGLMTNTAETVSQVDFVRVRKDLLLTVVIDQSHLIVAHEPVIRVRDACQMIERVVYIFMTYSKLFMILCR